MMGESGPEKDVFQKDVMAGDKWSHDEWTRLWLKQKQTQISLLMRDELI